MTSGSAFLDRIVTSKRDAMAAVGADVRRSTRGLALSLDKERKKHSFLHAIDRNDRINVIAEVKRSSPSVGTIRSDADAVSTARTYESAGAAAISVLTEPEFFKGSLQDLIDVAANVHVPLLRKDFTVDRHQIYEAAAAGASAVLLIVAALEAAELRDLLAIAEDELGMDALVEAHTAMEVESALAVGAKLVGVNNRNLQTLDVTLDTARALSSFIVPGKIFIAESGIKTAEDAAELHALGYRAILVGETLMRANDPSAALRGLVAGVAQ